MRKRRLVTIAVGAVVGVLGIGALTAPGEANPNHDGSGKEAGIFPRHKPTSSRSSPSPSRWFTEDHSYFLMGDELDELEGNVQETTTYIFDMTDLDAPELIGTGSSGLDSIDHNILINDNVAYESNHTSGLRMFDLFKVVQGRLKQIGWFDGQPADDETQFAGSWSNYLYFESGNVVFTGVEEGLFVVRPRVSSSAPR